MSIVLLGSTSGSCTLQEQAVAGTTTLTLPTFNGTVGLLVSGTAVSASSTSVDFTSIPAGVRRITVNFKSVSTNGSSLIRIQLGAGSVTTTGYSSSTTQIGTNTVASTSGTGGFDINSNSASFAISGSVVINLVSSNTWVGFGLVNIDGTAASCTTAGSIALGGTLDQVRITTVNGTDTFDAGTINILYE